MIEATELQRELEAGAAPMLLQITSPEVFVQAHIPGAIRVTPAQLVAGTPPATGRLPTRTQLQHLLTQIGFNGNRDIVVYDDEGGGWAGRMGWTLDVVGQRAWRYLNGGLHAWHAAGLPLAQGEGAPPAQEPTPAFSIDTTPIAEIDDVLAAIASDTHIIWDVRSREEYLGQRVAAARSGHIPGAVNLDWLHLKDPAAHQRLVPDLPAVLAELGIHAGTQVITHCQTHHRSGLSYMIGRILEIPIRAYHGSWSEWGNRDDTPIEV
ncbi:MAG: rhodanese-like domain-containing protein [Pseudomonadota bacterium]